MPGNWGFCGPTYISQSPNVDDEDAMNCYCEQSESPGAKVPIALLHTPGKKVFAQMEGESAIPSLFSVNGRTFAAASNLYELSAGSGVTNWGSIGTMPTRPTMMTANETQLVILNNGDLYTFTLSTNTLNAVDMGQFNGPVSQIDFIDGYVIATLQNSHTFQQSNLEDAGTWSGLNIATLSYFPDNIVTMKCDHRSIQFSSAKKTVWYYNAGAGFPVFIPIQGAFAETGACATYATAQMDNSVFQLSQDERGFLIGVRTNGYNFQRVSTHAVELAWQQYGTSLDALSWTYQEYGHTFWVVYFPTANATWAYDVATGYWHKRGFWNAVNGTYSADRAMCHTLNFGIHLVGDWASGTVYQLSSMFCTDFGNAIRGYRRSPTTAKDNKRFYFAQIEFDVEAGLGPSAADIAEWKAVYGVAPLTDGDGIARPAQLTLRWSNDAGKTWSYDYILSVGYAGQFLKRVIKRMLGRARKRVWEVSWTDPIPWRFADAYVEAEEEVG